MLIDQFVPRHFAVKPTAIAGRDARGFIIDSVVTYELQGGLVPFRKKGKLPITTVEATDEFEHGSATVKVHTAAAQLGDR